MTMPLTRSQVADALAISVTSVRRLESEGRLHPAIGLGGVHLFSPTEVEQLRRERGAELDVAPDAPRPAACVPTQVPEIDPPVAAEAFRRFEAGESPVSVVTLCGVQPNVAAILFRQWVELSDLWRRAAKR